MVRRGLWLALALVACGKPSWKDECNALASSSCKRMFECDKAKATMDYNSESRCRELLSSESGCGYPATCLFDEAAVKLCKSDVEGQSCSSLAMGMVQPSCTVSKLCDAITCGASDVSAGAAGCIITVHGATGPCSDGHTYGAHCMNATECDCQTDGMPNGFYFNTSSDLCQQTGDQQQAALKVGCEFQF